uniref:Uncharacterized protein n=1 Tax=Alexandrium monilatum TaxID=311494 RepID=A0A7S4VL39_9DINO
MEADACMELAAAEAAVEGLPGRIDAYAPVAAAHGVGHGIGPLVTARLLPRAARAAVAAFSALAVLACSVAVLYGSSLGRRILDAPAVGYAGSANPLPEASPTSRQPQALAAPPALESTVELQADVGASISLFCFSVVTPYGQDLALLQYQHQQKVSIFRCDEAAVFTNKTIDLQGVSVRVLDRELTCRLGEGAAWSFNAWLFIFIWRAVIEHGRWQYHTWTVKVDTDAVFFPERLGFMLQRYPGTSYLTSCRVGVHGPVEVLSRDALAVLAEDYAKSWDGMAPERCMTQEHLLAYGNCTRDSFLDVCLMKVLLSSSRTVDTNLACDKAYHCKEADTCSDDRASFHPHESVDDYAACVRNSMGVAG